MASSYLILSAIAIAGTAAATTDAHFDSATNSYSSFDVKFDMSKVLDVAPDSFPEGQWKDKLGMLHDQSGKFVGKAGFGHPPIQKYRLIVESVSDVKARELAKPKVPDEWSKSLLHESGHAQGLEAQL